MVLMTATFSNREVDLLKTHKRWLAEEMTDEKWEALGVWMRATDRQRGRALFPRDRLEFLRDPSAAHPVFWGWWTKGGKRHRKKSPPAAPAPEPAPPTAEERKELVKILKTP